VTSFALRAVLALFAVLVLAWLMLGARAVRLEDQASAVTDRARAGEAVAAAEVEQARERLGDARELSPDQGPSIREGQLLEAVGRKAEADFIARSVALAEPDNMQAWFLAWVAATDEEAKERALAQLRRLNPFVEVALGLRDCMDCPLKTP
jgi:hypothetical protein